MYKSFAFVAALSLVSMSAPAFAIDAKAGADLYNDNCAVCHGNKGEGYAKNSVPRGAVQIKKLAGDSAYWDFATFKHAVLDGKDDKDRPMRVMPVFAKTGLYEPAGQMLTDQNLHDIQAYMQSFGPKQ